MICFEVGGEASASCEFMKRNRDSGSFFGSTAAWCLGRKYQMQGDFDSRFESPSDLS